jgi:soluble lytic murein transglycosylase
MAMAELKKPIPLIQIRGLSEKVYSNDLTLDWLTYLGETNFARAYLQDINGELKKSMSRDNMFYLYDQTNWYQGAIRHLSSYPQSKKNEMTSKFASVIFPNAFETTIVENSKKYQVPKELILSIMRQESVYIPTERSPADAFGLMQLIPERARVLARDHGITYSEFNDLYKPEVNVELGTVLLARLMKDNQYKFAETVASYNADPKAMKKWIAERFHGDYIEFIEMIPYDETRNYIKLVFRNFITYKRIFGSEEFILDPKFFALPFN